MPSAIISTQNSLRFFALFLVSGLIFITQARAQSAPSDSEKITQQELVRRTQELMDAVAPGIKAPWEKYYAADAMFFDERGQSKDKAGLVADIVPLRSGYSGTIKVVNANSRIVGRTAILTYDMDETEVVFGATLHARYHATDTWMFRDAHWQIIAGQVLRYYEDPAQGEVDAAKFAEYAGTYELAPGVNLVVTLDAGKLYSQRGHNPRQALLPETTDLFFHPGVEGRYLFHRSAQGQVDKLIDRRNNEDLTWTKH
jgi:Domain of unknown function (DUF4440)/Domain of unknown function (DUF3471)